MIVIEPTFMSEVKLQCRITNSAFDTLISREIEVAIEYIYTQLIGIPTIPATTASMTAKQKLATSMLVAQWRTNGDGVQAIGTKYKVVNKRLIRNILGSELRYSSPETTVAQNDGKS